eukprot:1093952-Rhodomonas_salina.1
MSFHTVSVLAEGLLKALQLHEVVKGKVELTGRILDPVQRFEYLVDNPFLLVRVDTIMGSDEDSGRIALWRRLTENGSRGGK